MNDYSIPTTTITTTTTFAPAVQTTTTINSSTSITHRRYGMHSRGKNVVELQKVVGVKTDGIYGPVTRQAHMNFLGGNKEALYVFYPHFKELKHPLEPMHNLATLVSKYFKNENDQRWALRVAFCESSAESWHVGSTLVSSALAAGWFQHLATYWESRSRKAGWEGYDIFYGEANVATAAYLFYESGAQHWNPSRSCWEE
tara:strand:- start:270 stop:869 length:600 start_codon:yes stop_codon:yes gene_type:complete